MVAVISSLEAIIFYLFLNTITELSYDLLDFEIEALEEEPDLIFFEIDDNFYQTLSSWNFLLVLIFPTIGGILSGLITYVLPPMERSGESSVYIRAFHRNHCILSNHLSMIRLFASSFFIGMGCSAGREGPAVQIGAATSVFLSRKFRLSARERELLFIAGAAAGIGGIFRAPFGGALFGVEVLYKHDYEGEALPYAIIASIISFSLFSLITGWTPMFKAPSVYLSLKELPLYFVLGICCGLLARAYVAILNKSRDVFLKLKIKDYLKTAIGGLITGIIGFLCVIIIGAPYILGPGYEVIQLALNGDLFHHLSEIASSSLFIMLLMIGVIISFKMLATAASLGSMGSGGAFAPSITVGGLIGAMLGLIYKIFFPQYMVNEIGVFVIIGMASFFAAAANVPLAAIVMTAEITWDFNILIPAVIAVGVSYLIAAEQSIYQEQVSNKLSSPVHLIDDLFYAFRNLRVKDILSPDSKLYLKEDTSIERAINIMMKSQRMQLPVVDDKERCIGIVGIFNLISLVSADKKRPVKESIKKIAICVTPEEPLLFAIAKALRGHIMVLPVVDPHTNKIIGEITYHDMIKAFYAKLSELGI